MKVASVDRQEENESPLESIRLSRASCLLPKQVMLLIRESENG